MVVVQVKTQVGAGERSAYRFLNSDRIRLRDPLTTLLQSFIYNWLGNDYRLQLNRLSDLNWFGLSRFSNWLHLWFGFFCSLTLRCSLPYLFDVLQDRGGANHRSEHCVGWLASCFDAVLNVELEELHQAGHTLFKSVQQVIEDLQNRALGPVPQKINELFVSSRVCQKLAHYCWELLLNSVDEAQAGIEVFDQTCLHLIWHFNKPLDFLNRFLYKVWDGRCANNFFCDFPHTRSEIFNSCKVSFDKLHQLQLVKFLSYFL